jgi:hypothetical protein
MNHWLQSSGKLYIGQDAVRIIVSYDFVKYYKFLIDKEVRLFTGVSAHGGHITLWNPKLRGKLPPEKAKFLKEFYKNRDITFEYDPDIREGGQTKSFRNWYMNIRSMAATSICNYLNVQQNLHLTICNTKNGARPYIWFK